MGKAGEQMTVTKVWAHRNILLLGILLVRYFERFTLSK